MNNETELKDLHKRQKKASNDMTATFGAILIGIATFCMFFFAGFGWHLGRILALTWQ